MIIFFTESCDVQFPVDLLQEGVRYVVDDLHQDPSGKFYRVHGNIQQVQDGQT